MAAAGGTDFDEPVRLAEDLDVVVDENDGVPVLQQVSHDAEQSVHIGGMQADGGFVQDVEHAGRLVAHRARQLDTLPLTGGQGRACPVQAGR